MVDLVNDGFDLAIRLSTQHPPNYVARKLASIRLAVCASNAYLQRHGTPRTPKELSQHNCLAHTAGAYAEMWTFVGPEGRESVSIKGKFRANNGELLRAAALAGEGIILEPTFIVGDDLAKGDLVPLLPDWEIPQASAMAAEFETVQLATVPPVASAKRSMTSGYPPVNPRTSTG